MKHYIELLSMSDEYSIGNNNNLKEIFVRGDVDISGNIAMSGNINCNEINSTSIRGTTFYGDGSQLTGINTSGGSANLNEHSDVSFGNVDVSGNININGKVTITINDVNAQNITLLEMKTHSDTPRIKHDFWQNSTGYGDYQIYPASAATTDFKIGGYSSTFQTIRLNALNGIEVYSNQSTNTYGNIKCNTLELTNKIKGSSDLIIDPSPYDSSGGNVNVMGNLKVDGLLDMSNDIIMNNNRILFTASDSSIIPLDIGIITRIQDISNTLTNIVGNVTTLQTEMNDVEGNITILQGNVSNLLTSNNDASFNNVDISENVTVNDLLVDQRWGSNTTTLSHKSLTGLTNFGLYFNSSGYTVLNSSNDLNCDIKIDNVPKLTVASNLITFNTTIYTPYDLSVTGKQYGKYISASSHYTANDSRIKMWTRDMFIAAPWVHIGRQIDEITNLDWDYPHTSAQGYSRVTFNAKQIVSNAQFTPWSDDRIKHFEEPIINSLNILRQLKPQKYTKTIKIYSDNYNGPIDEEGTIESGFIAQEILKIPDLSYCVIDEYKDENGIIKIPYSLKYNDIFVYNVAATKELDIIVQSQQIEINDLKVENTLLKTKLNEILSEMGKETI